MGPRQDIIDIFSSYILIAAERFNGWCTDPRLKQSMARALAQSSDADASKHVWALYWHHHWPEHRLAKGHLTTYLQEAAFWTAKKLSTQFDLQQMGFGDCFQVTFTKLDKLLDSFQSNRGANLESFAKVFFRSTIKNELRRLHDVDLCSDWLLLRKTSRKRLLEALQNTGLGSQAIEQYRLAWMCFKHLYGEYQADGIQQLPKPSPEIWQAMTELYNRERVSQLMTPGLTISTHELEQWLEDCIRHLRAYSRTSAQSLNAPIPGTESGELQDNLAADELTPFEQVVAIAEQTQRRERHDQLGLVLTDSITTLGADDQKLLQLYYCDQFTQQKIAEQLKIKQYAVSRKIKRVRKKLLDHLLNWSSSQTIVALTTSDIETAAEHLELWLRNYFESPDSEDA